MQLNIKDFRGQLAKLWEKGAFHIFIGSFLTKFVAFFGSIFLVRVLSKTSYGVLGYIENIYGYVYIFSSMGLGNALLRYVILSKTPEEKFGYYSYTITRGTMFNLILFLIASIGALFYPHPAEFASAKWLLLIVLFAIPFQDVTDNNTLTYRAMLDNKRYAVTSFLISSVLISSKYIGAFLFDIKGVVLANLMVYASFAIGLCIISYNVYFKGIKPIQINRSKKKVVNSYALQYMITSGVWAVFMLNDIFLLGRLTGSAEIVASYKVAYVLAGNIALISNAIGIYVGPYFVQHETDNSWVWKNYKKVYGIIVALIAPLVLILFIFSKPIILLLYGIQYVDVVPIMRGLLIAAFANSALRYTTAHILSSMGQVKYNMIVSAVGMIFQVGLNIVVIPIYGALGAVFTSIFVYMMMALALAIVFIKKYRVKN